MTSNFFLHKGVTNFFWVSENVLVKSHAYQKYSLYSKGWYFEYKSLSKRFIMNLVCSKWAPLITFSREVAQLVRAPAWGTQVPKVLGSNPAAVYWLLGLCATGVLRPACNWEKLGAVTAASPLRQPLSHRLSPQIELVIRTSDFNQHFKSTFKPMSRGVKAC